MDDLPFEMLENMFEPNLLLLATLPGVCRAIHHKFRARRGYIMSKYFQATRMEDVRVQNRDSGPDVLYAPLYGTIWHEVGSLRHGPAYMRTVISRDKIITVVRMKYFLGRLFGRWTIETANVQTRGYFNSPDIPNNVIFVRARDYTSVYVTAHSQTRTMICRDGEISIDGLPCHCTRAPHPGTLQLVNNDLLLYQYLTNIIGDPVSRRLESGECVPRESSLPMRSILRDLVGYGAFMWMSHDIIDEEEYPPHRTQPWL